MSGEIDTSVPLKSSVLKVLTGEDSITVDQKYREAVTFRPTAKHVFAVNELPHFKDRTYALRRRAVFLEFKQKFEGAHRDPKLTDKLREELPGILNWSLDGLDALRKQGTFFKPASTLVLEQRFAEAINPAIAFVKERCCVGESEDAIARTVLYDAYEKWHRENISHFPLSRRTFYERIEADFPVERKRRRGQDVYRNIQLSRGRRGKR